MRTFLAAAVLFTVMSSTASAAGTATLRVRVLDASGPEGNSGTIILTTGYTLPFPVNNDVSGHYQTVDGTATAADGDYQPTSGDFFIPAGQTKSAPIDIVINGDTRVEGDETFSLVASNVQNASPPPPQVFTILNDDVAAVTLSSPSVNEGNAGITSLPFAVTLTAPASVVVRADYTTGGGTATGGVDYVVAAGFVLFEPGQTQQIVNIAVNGDTAFEPNETLTLTVTPAGGAPVTATGTIVNDDVPPPGAVSIVSGNAQHGPLGKQLPEPLIVQLLDTQGGPVAGATVQWRVVRGQALLSPASGPTNAAGRASTSVTPLSVGVIEIEASVAGFSVTFTLASATGLADRATGPIAVPIARALDQICARNEETFSPVCRALTNLGDGELTPVLERVAPQQSGAQAKVAGEVMSAVTSGIGARLAALRGGTERFSIQNLSLNWQGRPIPVALLAKAMFARQESQDDSSGSESDYNGWSAFLSGNLGTGERQAHDGQLGFDLDSRGLMFGVDRQFGDSVVGVSANLMQLDSTLSRSAGSVDTTGYALSLYGSRDGLLAGNGNAAGGGTRYDGMNVFGSVTLGRNRYESEHDVEIGPLPLSHARSTNDANVFAVAGGTGIAAHRGKTDFGFSLAGTWSRADVDDLTESGSGPLILFVQGHEIESAVATARFDLRSAWPVRFGTLLPSFGAEMIHEFKSGARLVTARFLRDRLDTSFTIPIDTPDTNYAKVSAGLQAGLAHGYSVYVEVTQDILRSDLHYRNIQFNIQKSF